MKGRGSFAVGPAEPLGYLCDIYRGNGRIDEISSKAYCVLPWIPGHEEAVTLNEQHVEWIHTGIAERWTTNDMDGFNPMPGSKFVDGNLDLLDRERPCGLEVFHR